MKRLLIHLCTSNDVSPVYSDQTNMLTPYLTFNRSFQTFFKYIKIRAQWQYMTVCIRPVIIVIELFYE